MIVVADSSPFVVLVKIGHVDILPSLFGRVLVPPQVHDELRSSKRSDELRAFVAASPAWLEIRSPSAIEQIAELHPAEAAAIALAREISADRIIIDERRGREAAKARGLLVVGTIGILEVAARRGFVDLESAFAKVKQTDFWVQPALLDERLENFRKWSREKS